MSIPTVVVSNDVTKLRARDGASLGTFPAGFSPTGVAFDGAHIWVANSGSDTVSKRGIGSFAFHSSTSSFLR